MSQWLTPEEKQVEALEKRIEVLEAQLANVTAQAGGSIAEAAAAKRERDAIRFAHDGCAEAISRSVADEREACAKLVEGIVEFSNDDGPDLLDRDQVAAAIRARGDR